jgi:hypothetical protein
MSIRCPGLPQTARGGGRAERMPAHRARAMKTDAYEPCPMRPMLSKCSANVEEEVDEGTAAAAGRGIHTNLRWRAQHHKRPRFPAHAPPPLTWCSVRDALLVFMGVAGVKTSACACIASVVSGAAGAARPSAPTPSAHRRAKNALLARDRVRLERLGLWHGREGAAARLLLGLGLGVANLERRGRRQRQQRRRRRLPVPGREAGNRCGGRHVPPRGKLLLRLRLRGKVLRHCGAGARRWPVGQNGREAALPCSALPDWPTNQTV